MEKCPYCDKRYSKAGLGTHIWRNHGDGKDHNPNKGFFSGRLAWNKGLSKETNESVNKSSKTYSERIKNGELSPPFLGKHHSLSSKIKISTKLSTNNKGGRCKWFSYKKESGESINLQGTWEIRFAKILDKIDPDWIKIGVGHKEHSFTWNDETNKGHLYTPDFFSPKLNKYFEIKGHWWGNDKLKMKLVISQNPNVTIEIVLKKDLEAYEKLWKGSADG